MSDETVKKNPDEAMLVERCLAAYNTVDHALRRLYGADRESSFSALVTRLVRERPQWVRKVEFLRLVAELRNFLVHGKTHPYKNLAVPTIETVDMLEGIAQQFTNPARAIPTFKKAVEAVETSTSLASVLRTIAKRDFSQFPVYESGAFRGLLTENGITRWLSHHVTTELSLVELNEVTVSEVIADEEERQTWAFAAQDRPVEELVGMFAGHELLEAVLITASGKDHEGLLGIATRWDIVQMK